MFWLGLCYVERLDQQQTVDSNYEASVCDVGSIFDNTSVTCDVTALICQHSSHQQQAICSSVTSHLSCFCQVLLKG